MQNVHYSADIHEFCIKRMNHHIGNLFSLVLSDLQQFQSSKSTSRIRTCTGLSSDANMDAK